MDAADETSVPPAQDYTTANGAQYVQNSYGYPPPTSAFAIDQSLQMPDGVDDYAANQNKNVAQRQGNSTSSLPEQNGTDDVDPRINSTNNSTGHPSISTSAQTALNPSTKRKSPDDSQDIPALGEPLSGRKRSKVSRACDQCRRKKVKCDSVTDSAGIPSTCTPCAKAGQTCDYSRVPQKRGPSKGYIKELSERVQQVEGQLALQNQGYRGSLDGSTTAFPDQPFSPDEEAARRQSAYSQHSPFSDIRREHRFPSIGGWQLNNSNTSYPRDRGSIAIPPDQRHPDHNLPLAPLLIPEKSVKPFWSEYTGFASKRQKLATDSVEPASLTIDDDSMPLPQYYKNIHPLCPILPDGNSKVLEVFQKASPEFQYAFLAALQALPQEVRSNTNSTMDSKNPYFDNIADLESFVKMEAVNTTKPSADDNHLVLLWILLLLIVASMHNVESYINVNLPLDDLIHMTLSLCFEIDRTEAYESSDSVPLDFARVAYSTALLARLHAFSIGSMDDPIPSTIQNRWLGKQTLHTHPFSGVVLPVANLLQCGLQLFPDAARPAFSDVFDIFARLCDTTLQTMAGLCVVDNKDPLLEELRAFLDLIQMRSRFRWDRRAQCLEPCLRLIDAIRVSASTTEASTYKYNPLSFHTYTMAAFTVLELLQCDYHDQSIASAVNGAVDKIRACLSQLIEKREAIPSGTGARFWASVLLDLIHERSSINVGVDGGTRKEEDEVCVDLAALMRQGYAIALLNAAVRKQ